jgi:hypothetical protein
MPAAPDFFFFLLVRLRDAITLRVILLLLRRGNSAPGFSTFDCIG